ncbi:MAG: zinc metallopeptidase [Pirellulaceae bacterium]
MFFDPLYLLFIAPAILLGMWAQARVRSTFSQASRIQVNMSGAQAARRVLDSAGLSNVGIEPVQGFLSDHYDPRHKVLRLSPDVYRGATMAAVGIAAHEAGHAIQDAQHYAPLVIRNAAVPVAQFGGGFSWIMIIIGVLMTSALPQMGPLLVWAGIAAYAGVVFFQLVNLPVEFDASNRAKAQLVSLGIVHQQDMGSVNRVLNAAAWTYVAGTLQAVMTLLYLLMRFGGRRD